MRFSMISLGALALATVTTPAFAQEATDPPPAITATGSLTAITDYRFRGLTQTDKDAAAQATLNLNHKSGLYVGTFVSTIDGDGSTPLLAGYGALEVDLYGGYTKTFSNGIGIDGGLLYYWYADAAKGLNTDFFEPYAAVTGTYGPVSGKIGAAYSWGGQKGLNFTSGNDDSLYLYGEAAVAIPKTPVTLKAHAGHTKGALGLANPNVSDDSYWDVSLGAEAAFGKIKLGGSYIDTDVTDRVRTGKYAGPLGRGSTILGYASFSF